MTGRIFIVRHGNTFETGEIVRRIGGRTDMALSKSGQAQAESLAQHFLGEGVCFATARSGPLRRTRETAAASLGAQAAPPDLLTELFLREIDYGPDENRPEADVVARIGEAAMAAWEESGAPPPGWRVDPAALVGNWQELLRELRGEPGDHLVVTSNGIARFALEAINARRSDLKLATGAYGVFALGEPEALVSWNIRP